MTWVIGASSLFGYGVMISDVRITFADGSEADILRKAYVVGPYMLAGFAGSVRIGMSLIDHLQRCLINTVEEMGETPEGHAFAFNPDAVIEDWAPDAAKIFQEMPEEERNLGAQIIIVGVDSRVQPQEFPRVHIAKLSWPDFRPQFSSQRWDVQHIGSGSGIEPFVQAIGENFKIDASSLNAEMGGPDGWASMLGHNVGMLVQKYPVAGIGAHVNIDVCRLGDFSHGVNDRRTFHHDGTIEEFKMPIIAHNYEDFLKLCNQRGKSAVGAVGKL